MPESPYHVIRGIVLRQTQTRESDKILTLLTAELGKLGVIAGGARRKGCRFAACAQPLAYSEWTLYKKGEWYHANDGQTIELFSAARQDLEATALCFYLSELTESVATEEAPQEALLRLLLNALYAVSSLRKPLPLVKAAFELRLLCLSGYQPHLDGCLACGCADPPRPCLEPRQGGLVCRSCGGEAALPLCPASLAAMRHAVFCDPRRLYSFSLGPEAMKRLGAAAEAYLCAQLERGFRTLDFYNGLCGPDGLVH